MNRDTRTHALTEEHTVRSGRDRTDEMQTR